ncbi:GNAT family N-acetyltransferase [Streptomyces sp. IB2014 016-6]|uniref:GNAT family N-acetyltransferase n=1 Tax=Streptomyces sp. IB2014 016-6 TaxID=2517818 RepID=UPI0011CA4DEB|nr:GNAT family N-acetyltransferase [Streptomyces sp. IB2014 016-6]TXL86079.1 GNAT family N-acetyltransferase [Streptomyces sp. IB2014 016-6]
MTTTLRPTGPLQKTDDGMASRGYEVCDNSRSVGRIELGMDGAFGTPAGVLRRLRIDEADRRRGRGTIAVLAAEEVLRGWGCGQVVASVPAEAEGALRLLETLGHTERSRNMLKELDREPPVLPTGLVGRGMERAEYALWAERSFEGFRQSWTDRGLPEEQARAKAESSRRQLLPDGLASPGTSIDVLVHDGEVVGHVWVGTRELSPGAVVAFVYDVEVPEEQRGKGYGRALMLHAERIADGMGSGALGLHVFAGNAPAIGLYESLGYVTTHRNLFKTLL